MLCMIKRTPITEEQIAQAARMKALFLQNKVVWEKRTGGKLTQDKLAELLGMTQGAVWQYLNGRVALNRNFVLDMAELLGFSPEEIDPIFSISVKPGSRIHQLIDKLSADLMAVDSRDREAKNRNGERNGAGGHR